MNPPMNGATKLLIVFCFIGILLVTAMFGNYFWTRHTTIQAHEAYLQQNPAHRTAAGKYAECLNPRLGAAWETEIRPEQMVNLLQTDRISYQELAETYSSLGCGDLNESP